MWMRIGVVGKQEGSWRMFMYYGLALSASSMGLFCIFL